MRQNEWVLTHITAPKPAGRSGKRAAILAAAQEVLVRRGFHQARTAEIAAAAGVSEGTLYNYFPSREEIFFTLFDERWGDFTERVRRRAARCDDPNDRLKAVFAEAFRLFVANRALARIFLLELSPGGVFADPRVAMRLADFLDLIEEIIAEGKARGRYHPRLDPRVARLLIYGMVQGLLFAWTLQDTSSPEVRQRFRFPLLKVRETLKLLLKSGLLAPPRRGRAGA